MFTLCASLICVFKLPVNTEVNYCNVSDFHRNYKKHAFKKEKYN